MQPATYKIKCGSLAGTREREIDVDAQMTIGQLKSEYAELEKLNPSDLQFVFGSETCTDEQKLSDLGIVEGSSIIVAVTQTGIDLIRSLYFVFVEHLPSSCARRCSPQ